jgi:hypothetical protein
MEWLEDGLTYRIARMYALPKVVMVADRDAAVPAGKQACEVNIRGGVVSDCSIVVWARGSVGWKRVHDSSGVVRGKGRTKNTEE